MSTTGATEEDARAANLRGATWMTTAMGAYVVNDGLVKWIAEDLPLFQTVFLRGVCVSVLLAAIVHRQGERRPLQHFRSRALQVRVGCEALGTIIYLTTLTQVPLADLTATLQLLPVAITFVAARLLREPVDRVRIGAVAAGFLGVMLIIRPGSDGFTPWLFGGLITVGVLLIRELATLRLPGEVSGPTAALGTAITVMAVGLAISVFQGWDQPSGLRIAAIVATSCFLGIGYIGSVNSVRTGDISFTAPFRYTILLFAIIVQVALFGEVPDLWTFIGAGIVAAAGLAVMRRERRSTSGAEPIR